MAFDVGTVRVGVATSDPDGILAVPAQTLLRQDELALSRAIAELIEEVQPIAIYVGLPTNLKNDITASTRDAITFARWLAETIRIPIWLIDERMSTGSAAAALRSSGRTSRNSRTIIDQQAAVEILESALSLEKKSRAAGVRLDEYEH